MQSLFLTPSRMTTIIERRGSSEGDSSMSSVLVAVIAIVVILGFALFMFRVLPFGQNAGGGTDSGTIDVNVEGQIPTGTNQ
jgi:hypothetical protein